MEKQEIKRGFFWDGHKKKDAWGKEFKTLSPKILQPAMERMTDSASLF